MSNTLADFAAYMKGGNCPRHDKALLERALAQRFKLTKDRRVYYCRHFALRVCYTKGRAFSNTVISLSCLQKYDAKPFLVILVSKVEENRVFLANTTFLKKISHSSQELRVDNIRGSFNGSDIQKTFQEIPNDLEHLEELFAYHSGMTWEDNLARLVEATNRTEARGRRYNPTDEERRNIVASVALAEEFCAGPGYAELRRDLNERTRGVGAGIAVAARIENVNIRGRLIEALVTADGDERQAICKALREEESLPECATRNDLGDYRRVIDGRSTYTDIKTKVVYLSSNPKAFNIDKFLECMAEGDSVFLFYFIGIDENGVADTVLCPVYHPVVLDNIKVQHHWCGLNSRGVTQLVGKGIDILLRSGDFKPDIDHGKAEAFLEDLLDIE